MMALAGEFSALNMIIGGLFRRLGLGACGVTIIEIEDCCNRVDSETLFKDVAELYYGPEAREIAYLCRRLAGMLKATAEKVLGVALVSPTEHYRMFFESLYPVS